MKYKFSALYDVIYLSLTFMHIEDKLTAINKIVGLLESGGRFVLSIDKNQDEYIDDNPDDIVDISKQQDCGWKSDWKRSSLIYW